MDYDFELLVTPEEFKRNKERHQKAMQKEQSKRGTFKTILSCVGVTLFVIAMVFGPAVIEILL